MDDRTFDDVIRMFGSTRSRRATLAALAGAALGAAVSPVGAADRLRSRASSKGPCGNGSTKDNACRKNAACCTGICDRTKSSCICAKKGKSCTEDRNCCSGKKCVSRICGGPASPSCGPASCAAGCCDGNTCVARSNQSKNRCGTGGAACASCTGSNTCVNGICTPPCNASTCATGCCLGDTCLSFANQTEQYCGTGGAACDSCNTGDSCNSGVCSYVCNSATCPDGCCNGNSCVELADTSDAQCGTSGTACEDCTSYNYSCIGGSCVDSQ
ncbi:MAG: hypothetical protein ACR2J8_15470 [Thermomicrobiales bacterium]